MKKIFLLLLTFLVLGCSGVTREEKIVQENYKKFQDNLVTDNVFYIPQIPAGIDRPDKEGLYNLTIGEDTFIVKKIHIIDYKNTFSKRKIKHKIKLIPKYTIIIFLVKITLFSCGVVSGFPFSNLSDS